MTIVWLMRTDLLRVCSICRIRTHTGYVECPKCYAQLKSTTDSWLRRGASVGLDDESVSSGSQVVEGRIIAGRRLRGPLTGLRCAGFTLYGQVDGHAVADAAISRFEIEVSPSVSMIVDAEVASLVLQRDGPSSIPLQGDNSVLEDFLEERGIRMVNVALAEAMVREGDWVRVSSDLHRLAEAIVREEDWVRASDLHQRHPYRHARRESRLLGDAKRPLVVELLDSGDSG